MTDPDFQLDTAVEESGGRYIGLIPEHWQALAAPLGGFVAAIALRAIGCEAPGFQPVSFTCHYLRPPPFGEVDVVVVPLHDGKRARTFRATLGDAKGPILESLAWVARETEGLEFAALSMPDVPGPDDSAPSSEVVTDEMIARWPKAGANFEWRWPEPYVVAAGPGTAPRIRRWMRFLGASRGTDPFALGARHLVLADFLGLPAVSVRDGEPVFHHPFLAPNLDLTVHFHHPADPSAWLLAEASASVAAHGLIGTQIRCWSPQGRLLASGLSQLLCRRVVPASKP